MIVRKTRLKAGCILKFCGMFVLSGCCVFFGDQRKQKGLGEVMKKLYGKVTAVWLAVGMAAVLGGCGSSKNMMNYEETYDTAYQTEAGSAAYAGGSYSMSEELAADANEFESSSDTDAAVTAADRKLIRTVNLSVETKEFDTMLSALENQIRELGGYIENMNTYNGSSYSGYRSARNADMTIRIPRDKLDGFLDTVSGISNVISRSENVEDVTLDYVDIESRKQALTVEQERLLALLEKAENIEDIITIEERLSDVRYQLESMESRLRTYDNQVDYSTVYLNIDEVKELTPVAEKTAWERMADGFADSLKDLGNGFKEFAIWLVIHIPYLVVWVLVILAIVFFVKAMVKRSEKKKKKKFEQARSAANVQAGMNAPNAVQNNNGQNDTKKK